MNYLCAVVIILALALQNGKVGSVPFEEVYVPSLCEKTVNPGDHVLITYSSVFSNGSAGPAHPAFTQPLHAVLEPHENLPIHQAIEGMCENGTRLLKWSSLSELLDVALHPIINLKKLLPLDIIRNGGGDGDENQGFTLELHVEHITDPKDFQIFEAFRKENISRVLDLIDEHVGINAVDEYGQTSLMLAVSKGYNAVVASLLNARMPKVEVNAAKTSGFTALFYAVENATPSIVQALLKRGAEPNLQIKQEGSRGNTPLHFACLLEKIKAVELLLEYGANPLSKNEHNQTPLQLLPADSVRSTKLHLLEIFKAAQRKIEESTAEAATGFGSPRDL